MEMEKTSCGDGARIRDGDYGMDTWPPVQHRVVMTIRAGEVCECGQAGLGLQGNHLGLCSEPGLNEI